MKTRNQLLFSFVVTMLITLVPGHSSARDYKMTTPIAPGIAVPDKIETSIGTLHLSDGVPNTETTKKIYDNFSAHLLDQGPMFGDRNMAENCSKQTE